MPRFSRFLIFAQLLAIVTSPSVAQADTIMISAAKPVSTPAIPNASPFETGRLTENALKSQAGREDVALVAKSTNTATVARNSVGDNSKTGEVRVADQAFQNLSGLSLLNINTGNNVAINASMNVNISITSGQ